MDLLEIHTLIDDLLRHNQGGMASPAQKDRALNHAQTDLFEEFKAQYGLNEQMHDALSPFKQEQSFTNGNSAAGLLTLNADYVHLLSVETVLTDSNGTHYIPVEMMGEDEISYRKNSQLVPVTIYNPIGMLKKGKTLQLYPMQPFAGTIYYLRKPLSCQLVYTTSPAVRLSYDSVNSVQLEWNDAACQRIIFKALGYLGLNLQDLTSISWAQAKEGINGNQ